MIAKLTLYPDHTGPEPQSENPAGDAAGGRQNWQLVAENLTNGNLIDLLLHLDELGFLNVAADPGRFD